MSKRNNNNRNIIFDDGATVVERIIPTDEAVVVEKKAPMRSYEPKELSVTDVLDTFAGYLQPRLEIESDTDSGECLICGEHTSKSLRKICFECLLNNKDDIYKKTKEAIINGEMSITL